MTISTRLVATALASTLVTVTPAFAQHRSSGGRGHSASSGGQARGGAVVRSGSRPVASGGYGRVAGRAYYARTAPVRFYSPYYAFRPRFNFGFGLWLGYPVAYSAGFYAPYYSYPYYDPYYYGAPYPIPIRTRTTTHTRMAVLRTVGRRQRIRRMGIRHDWVSAEWVSAKRVSAEHNAAARQCNSADPVFESVIESKLPGEPIGECRRSA